jgi:TrmH family RNA methyltransferase
MTITSRQNPLVARFRDAARGNAGGVMLLDGAHLVADAIAAGIGITIAVVTPAARGRGEIERLVDALSANGATVSTIAQPVMDAISPVRSASGIVALAERPESDGDRLYAGAEPLVVVAVDVQDPGNVGAIVRVAEAAGATGFVAAGASAHPHGWKALRGSMGSGLRLPLTSGIDSIAAVADARRRGCRIVATAPHGGVPIFDAVLTGPLAVLIGGEGPGLPTAMVDAADERVTIPMKAPVESLNAAVTAGVVLFEIQRRRHDNKDTKTQDKRHKTKDIRQNT